MKTFSDDPQYKGHLKVILIGPGGAGKTSLTYSLLGVPHETSSVTTGIDLYTDALGIDTRTCVMNSDGGWCATSIVTKRNVLKQADMVFDPLNIAFLDFAGQMEYRPIYSLFIPQEAIPIVTFDASKEVVTTCHHIHWCSWSVDRAYKIDDNITKNNHLKAVEYSSLLLPPMLLAGTHIDLLHTDIEKARRLAKVKFIPELKKLFKSSYAQHLVGISEGIETALERSVFFVSNRKLDEEMQRLQYTITQVALQLKKYYPTTHMYYQIEHALSSCKFQVIPQSQVTSMITKEPMSMISMDGNAELRSILRYLNNKREILHFNQVEPLKDVVIPNPHWLAKLFGYILTSYPHNVSEPEYKRAWQQLKLTGVLHETLLHHMLAKYFTDYPSAPLIDYHQLLDMLLNFYLLAHVTNKKCLSGIDVTDSGSVFVIPSLAPVDASHKIALDEQKKAIIHYEFRDDIGPNFILNQLIVGCICRNVNRSQMVWW